MLGDSKPFSGFAVDDTAKAKEFYEGTLGLDVKTYDEDLGLLALDHGDGHETFIYRKDDFVPATYTILNFSVPDLDAAVDGLSEKGVAFELYDGFEQDEKGIARGPEGPPIAWFRDPAGNILAVMTME